MHAEAVLLVDYDEAKLGEIDTVLKQRVSAHDDLRTAVQNGLQLGFALLAFNLAAEPAHAQA